MARGHQAAVTSSVPGNFCPAFCVLFHERMRRRIHLTFLCLLLFGPAARLSAQDAGKIVEQHVKAAGGAKALSAVRTLALQGTVAGSGDATAGTFTLETKLPNRYYLELISGDKRLIEAYDGKSAWCETEPGSPRTLLGPESVAVEATAQIENTRLMNLKKNKLTVTYVAGGSVRGKPAEQIEVVTATGAKRQMFFDSRSH